MIDSKVTLTALGKNIGSTMSNLGVAIMSQSGGGTLWYGWNYICTKNWLKGFFNSWVWFKFKIEFHKNI